MKKNKVLAMVLAGILAAALCGCAKDDAPKKVVESLQDLKGEVVYNIGKSSPPDLTFRYILKANGIEYGFGDTAVTGKVMLSYASDSTAARALLESGKAKYVIAAEPSVTPILSEVKGSKQLFELAEEYNKITKTESSFAQSCLVVKTKFLAEKPDAVSAVCEQLKESTEWAQNNIEAAKTAIKAAGSITMNALSSVSAKRSAVVFKDAFANKSFIEGYYTNIMGVTIGDEPNPIGKMPAETFYAKDYITSAKTSDEIIKIYAPDGSPCLALAKMIADGANSKTKNAQINIVKGSEIGNNVIKNADMAIMPITAAANLSAKNIPIVMIAITTTGSLYMLTK